MTVALIIGLFVLCRILECALDYDVATDNAPEQLWHRIIRRINKILDKEAVPHV